MSSENHRRVRHLFDEALARPEPERATFLQTACGGNTEMLGQVTQLLSAHVQAANFLEAELPRPQRIGRYVVTSEVGRGAMGIVYRAIDPLIGRDVAIKVIRLPAMADSNEAAFLRERLFREARSAGSLFHPGIAVILDVGQEGDLPFIAMEFVEGPSLFQMLTALPKMGRAEALQILQQAASALDFAHGKGVVHRDIKPANILLEKGVTVKVADFGIAKITSSQHYTKTGVTMGTPSYMSPEQLDAKHLDGKSDQFSLAVVAYELLTGDQPFQADSFSALVHTIASGPRPSARAANPELPEGVDQVFYRGLGKRPEERYANCREFVAALERALADPASGAQGGETPGGRSLAGIPARYIRGIAVAAIFLIAAGLGYKWLAGAPPTALPKTPAPSDRKTVPPSVAPVVAQFLADPLTIEPGAQATLTWEVGAARDVEIEPGIGKVQAAGSVPVKPPKSTRYVLTATNAAGQVIQEAFVEVGAAGVSPLSLYLDGKSKLRRKQYSAGYDLLRQAGELGETRAMIELGEAFMEDGEGHARDDEEALYWVGKAAGAGVPKGMLYLGGFYEAGIGAPENDEMAVLWYRKAADRGSSVAARDVARMYEDGRGVPRDLDKAREFYQRADKMGSADARKWLDSHPR